MEVNIEKIMEEIREEIKEKGYDDSMLSFEDLTPSTFQQVDESFNYDFLIENINYINNYYNVVSYRHLEGNAIVAFVKKVIRKLTKFYIEPIVTSQNELNVCFVRILNSVKDFIKENEDLKHQYNEASQLVYVLELKQKNMEREIEEMKVQLKNFKNQKDELI